MLLSEKSLQIYCQGQVEKEADPDKNVLNIY